MVAIPFPISHSPGIKPQEGAGYLINCFAEKMEQGARFPVRWTRSGGLRQLVEIADHTHFRGSILEAATLIVAMDSRVYAVTKSGETYTATNLGALAGDGPITVAKNNASTVNIVCVTENGCFNLFTDSAPTDFADADLAQPNSVSSLNGYFIWTIGDGRIFASELNSVSVATNSFTTEQGQALLRGVAYRGEFYAFGERWCGVYRDAGTSPFPLERIATIPRGIAGTHCIAGWEYGWANELIWVGEDSIVYKLNAYEPVAVSNHDVARDIEDAARNGDHDQLEAFIYMNAGHAFWALTYPGYWTWEYNNTTGNWNKRQSYGRDDWRGSQSIRAFDEWIVGDRTTGKIFASCNCTHREGENPLIMEMVSGVVSNFPGRMAAPRADFDFTGATGLATGEDPIQTDPKALISWSDDGGYSYSDPVQRSLGGEGVSDKTVTVLRTGRVKSKGRRFKLVVSDPVHVGFMGGQMVAQQRAA